MGPKLWWRQRMYSTGYSQHDTKGPAKIEQQMKAGEAGDVRGIVKTFRRPVAMHCASSAKKRMKNKDIPYELVTRTGAILVVNHWETCNHSDERDPNAAMSRDVRSLIIRATRDGGNGIRGNRSGGHLDRGRQGCKDIVLLNCRGSPREGRTMTTMIVKGQIQDVTGRFLNGSRSVLVQLSTFGQCMGLFPGGELLCLGFGAEEMGECVESIGVRLTTMHLILLSIIHLDVSNGGSQQAATQPQFSQFSNPAGPSWFLPQPQIWFGMFSTFGMWELPHNTQNITQYGIPPQF
ncbi:hypothetical protein DFH29DRAFT_1074021 [Suillus ampliporus]|nr:hypothetical protein DFH29DRAFT_1074021 [Suillus ampliporus]